MGQDSKIEWTHHTFNPWRGCTKVSDGCKHCYADTLSHRNPKTLGVWGPNGTRVVAADSAWKEPLKWERLAKEAGERHRVFCASLADVFEGAETMPAASLAAVRAARVRLFDLIRRTSHLDWLLLTKRPQNWRDVIEETLILCQGGDPEDKSFFERHGDDFPKGDLAWWLNNWLGEEPPANVWLGTSVENQPTADDRIWRLIQCPAAVRFLSVEPLLGAVTIKMPNFGYWTCPVCGGARDWDNHAPFTFRDRTGVDDDVICHGSTPDGSSCDYVGEMVFNRHLHWVIVGGESGPGARPMHPEWARSIRDQCAAAGVPFFFKQWGEFQPFVDESRYTAGTTENEQNAHVWMDASGLHGKCWIADDDHLWSNWTGEPPMRSRGDPEDGAIAKSVAVFSRVGKSAAGRLLDGGEHNGMPAVSNVEPVTNPPT